MLLYMLIFKGAVNAAPKNMEQEHDNKMVIAILYPLCSPLFTTPLHLCSKHTIIQ